MYYDDWHEMNKFESNFIKLMWGFRLNYQYKDYTGMFSAKGTHILRVEKNSRGKSKRD